LTFSLNEIDSLSKRAARGAGFSWGLAEEAGKAVRWLAARNLSGPQALANLLTQNDGKAYAALAPVSTDGLWCAASGPLCPLITGAALCDRAVEIGAGRTVELGPTSQPLLLLPFAAAVAGITGLIIELSWAGMVIVMTPQTVLLKGDSAALTIPCADSLRCRSIETAESAAASAPISASHSGREVDMGIWQQLDMFAARTFAPATEASRLAGAGAGLSDND
jgi:hypothetical protein